MIKHIVVAKKWFVVVWFGILKKIKFLIVSLGIYLDSIVLKRAFGDTYREDLCMTRPRLGGFLLF